MQTRYIVTDRSGQITMRETNNRSYAIKIAKEYCRCGIVVAVYDNETQSYITK
jgi:hypothetical protein